MRQGMGRLAGWLQGGRQLAAWFLLLCVGGGAEGGLL